MSKREAINRYSLIIQRVRKAPATFQDITDYLAEESDYDDNFFNHNWNEFQFREGHPLQSIRMCYTMHSMVFDTHILSWDDLLNVDNVWIEFHVDFQFFTNKDMEIGD